MMVMSLNLSGICYRLKCIYCNHWNKVPNRSKPNYKVLYKKNLNHKKEKWKYRIGDDEGKEERKEIGEKKKMGEKILDS